jgi:hypothetical protein
MRVLGMKGIVLAQRLGLLTALPMLPWFMPNLDLSKSLFRHSLRIVQDMLDHGLGARPPPGYLNRLGRCLVIAGGRGVWSKKFAPP